MSRKGVVPMAPRSDIAGAVELRTRDLDGLTALNGPAAVDAVLRILTELQDVLAGSGSPAAGVNAHINFDLPFALLATLRYAPAFPATPDRPEYRDYLKVNDIFYDVLPQALDFTVGHDSFLSWLYRLLDVRDNAEQLIELARRMAWLVCENHLWSVPVDEIRALRRREGWIDWLVAQLGEEMIGPAGHLVFGVEDEVA